MFNNDEDKKEKKKENIFIFKSIYQNMSQTQISPYFIYYLVAKWMFIYVLYFSNPLISQVGFCKMRFALFKLLLVSVI